VLLISKIDEARTHKGSDLMTMAGYTARIGQWDRFDRRWRKGLHKAGLEYFHAQEMPSHPFGLKGAKIADDNLMFGFVIRLDRRDYEEVYRAGSWGGKAQPDSMYGLCFRYCLGAVLEFGKHEYPDDLTLNFIIESGHQNEGAPNEIVNRLKRQKISGVSECLGTVTPVNKTECYGLQAADGLATGAAWVEAGEVPPVPLVDISGAGRLSALYGQSHQKAPLFRCHIDRDEIAKFRDAYFTLIDLRRKFGQQRNAEIAARKT
jgi:hypothetical protein